jgi:hypothetical protein
VAETTPAFKRALQKLATLLMGAAKDVEEEAA